MGIFDKRGPTKDEERNYLESGGMNCPLCGSDSLDAQPADHDGDVATSEVICNDCLGSWTDVYNLVGITKIMEG